MRIPAILELFGLCVIASSASAQVGAIDPLSIPPGTQARMIGVGSSTGYIKLTIIDVNRDSVRYRLNSDAGTKSLAWQGISRMDVSGGSHSNIARGLGFGFLIGLVGGAILGASAARSAPTGERQLVGPNAALGGILGGAFGGLVGGVFGLVARTEVWVPVSIPHAPTEPTTSR